jgi:hypothetical protein
MVNSEGLIGTIEYLTVQAWCRINRCHFIQVRLFKIINRYIFHLVL